MCACSFQSWLFPANVPHGGWRMMRWNCRTCAMRLGVLIMVAVRASAQSALIVTGQNGCERCIAWEVTHVAGSRRVAADNPSPSGPAVQPSLPRPKISDSLGTRIVEYDLMPPPSPTNSRFADPFSFTLRAVPDAFGIAREPFVQIGGQRSNPDEELDAMHPMVSSLLLGNGTVVVNDRTQLKFFRRDGTLVRTVGRQGHGPMEFTQTRAMCRVRGDSVLVFDYSGKTSLWDSAGRFARAFARPRGRTFPGVCDEFGNVVSQDVAARGSPGAADDADRLVATRLIRPDGSVVRELGSLPGPDFRGMIGRSPSIVPLPGSLLVCGARSYELQWRTMSGATRQIARLRRRPLPITEEEAVDRVVRSVPRDVARHEREARIQRARARGFPKNWPAHSEVRVDVVGRVWVADYESEAAWTVFDSTGVLMGRIDLSRGRPLLRIRLLEVGRDFIAIAEPDADGAVRITYHRIVGTGAR
jgi:hypothetical protein